MAHSIARSSPRNRIGAAMALGGLTLLALVVLLSAALAANAGETLTRNTVRLSLAWYFATLLLVMQLNRADWTATTRAGQLARWCWTLAWACFLVHLVMAFHYYHHWSHADAFERTRQISGLGEGLYVSYAFTMLWTADVLFWWLQPARYAARSPWIDRTLHAFMLFVVFNSMVVFESGFIRWAGVVMFVALAIAWITEKTSFRPH